MKMKREVKTFSTRYTEVSDSEDPFTIVVTKYGVEFRGDSLPLETERELQEFAEYTGEAWKEFRKMSPAKALHIVGGTNGQDGSDRREPEARGVGAPGDVPEGNGATAGGSVRGGEAVQTDAGETPA